MTRASLSGWGRTAAATCDVRSPLDEAGVVALLDSGEKLVARGLGRSYGDAAQLSGGIVVDVRGLDHVGPIADDGVVTVGAGVSFDDLLRVAMPAGWFVPVTPGTRHVTLGGAVGADVHGKNHHQDGSFARHVLSLRLATPQGVEDVAPATDPTLFWGTMGAMGLTGVVTSLSLRLIPLTSDQVLVDTERFEDLDALMSAMDEGDSAFRYSVAWVDCASPGRRAGRGVLTRANHASAAIGDADRRRAPSASRVSVPLVAPPGLLSPRSVRAFNEAWFRSAPRRATEKPTSVTRFFHPLDGLGHWNRLYGPRGFVQYQFCVPDTGTETVREAIERLSRSGVASFLAVLKRFGPANPAPLSFPLAGWTLALDLPVGDPSLPTLLDRLDETVAAVGGRVYLAKDARLRPELVRAMYPRLEELLEVKSRVDPRGQLTSDLARRLDLVGR